MDSQNRILIAITLSVLVLVTYQKVFIPQARPKTNRIITVSSSTNTPEKEPIKRDFEEKTAILENKTLKIQITNAGAFIKQIWLKKYSDPKSNTPINILDEKVITETYAGPALLEDKFSETPQAAKWELAEHDPEHARYVLKGVAGVDITKEIFLHNSSYGIELRLSIKNNSSLPTIVNYKLIGASSIFSKQELDDRFVGIDIKMGEDIKRLNPKSKTLATGGNTYYNSPKWISIRGRYFSLVLEPKQEEQGCFAERENKTSVQTGVIIGPITMKPGETISREFILYAGPNDTAEIQKTSQNMYDAITFGIFGSISSALLKMLNFLNKVLGNYGLAIIVLTILVNLVLFPLTAKSLKSMKAMQALQPEMERLRRELKDNQQKLSKETMELYKKHKINPLGGCLPMLLQMPVFIALYQTLIRAIELKGAHFLWIKDLSEADATIKLPGVMPLVGNAINILPLFMIAAMFLQQKISQPKGAQTEQQRMFAFIVPVMVGMFTYTLPSGFVLYWFTSTSIMIIMQEFVLKVRHA